MNDLKVSMGIVALGMGVVGLGLLMTGGLTSGDGAMLIGLFGVLMRFLSLGLGIIAMVRNEGRWVGLAAILIFLGSGFAFVIR